MDLGIETQRWVWVPILGLGIKTLKGRQREAVQECLLLCTRKNRNLCLERGGVPVRGWEEEVPLLTPSLMKWCLAPCRCCPRSMR